MAASLGTQESYPTATTGGGIPTWLSMTGSPYPITNANPETAAPNGVTYGGNNTFQTNLSIAHTPTCTVTVFLRDNLTATPSITVANLQVDSYNSNPSTVAGTQESYPTPNAVKGEVVTISSVGAAGGTTAATFIITAQNAGQAQVDVSYPSFANGQGVIGAGPADGTYNRGQASRLTVSTGSNLLQWPLGEIYATLLVNVGP